MSWLPADSILKAIEKNADKETKKAFHGVYAIDNLPTFISHYPFMMIVNTHTNNLSGEHWLAIFIDKDRNGELFDSLSFPVNTTIMRWTNKFTRKWLTNASRFQNPLSAT